MFDNPFTGIQSDASQMRSGMMPVSSHSLLPMNADLIGSNNISGQGGEEQKLCAVCNDNAICQHYGLWQNIKI